MSGQSPCAYIFYFVVCIHFPSACSVLCRLYGRQAYPSNSLSRDMTTAA